MPTLLAMPHHGPGWGLEQDTDIPGHKRDTHSKEACSSAASETRDDGRHGTTDTAGVNPPNLQIPGNPFSRTIDSTISTGWMESDNTRLNPPCLQATGKPEMGENKNQMHTENRKRRRALQQAEQATPLWMTRKGI
jgi:hypothetical protein